MTTMTTDSTTSPNPRSHPDNANLPTINHPATILGITIAFLLLAVIAISLRLWVRYRDKLWGLDDTFVIFAGVASVVGNVMVGQMPSDGLGLHLWTLDSAHLMSYFKHVFATNVAYCASATFIKLSILFQYLRLFAETTSSARPAQYRLARRLTWSLIFVSSVWGLVFFSLALFSCRPMAKNWNHTLPGKCIGWGAKEPNEFFAMFLGHSVSNTLLDLLVLGLPVPFLAILRPAGKGKAGLITLFTLGCIVAAVAIGRMIALSMNRAGTVPTFDMPFYTPSLYIFGVLEVNIAIVAASIPIFWPIILTLASNKIFVVNEIEIHIEEASRSSFGSGRGISLPDKSAWKQKDGKNPSSGRTAKFTTAAEMYNNMAARSNHQHNKSNASSLRRTAGQDTNFGPRSSSDSQRCLHLTTSHENASFQASSARSDGEDWFIEMDKEIAGGRNTTTVERTEIPFEHIKAIDNRRGL